MRATRTPRAKRREQIVETAVEVFGRQGYRQGSLKDVADAVGLTAQGLLHHFPTKEALLMATLDHRGMAHLDAMNRAKPGAGFTAVGRYILQENLEHPGFMRLYITLSAEATDPEHPAHEYFVARYERSRELFMDAFRDGVQAGEIDSSIDADLAASQLVAMMDGLQLQKLLRPELDVLKTYDDAVHRLLGVRVGS
ncbi:TetR family transcriptional regulator [Microterricola gilva]|uniref:TetR family transcriptional regulator n=1 Tax=Microterricola gilva TaxID=393267 RepID=A0A4V6MGK6_9MICO|nr:TetR family transcriptional regulator [Microterricola gilva]